MMYGGACLWRPEGAGSPEAGVSGDGKALEVDVVNQTQVFSERSILTTDVSL